MIQQYVLLTEFIINAVILSFLVIVAIAIGRQKNLFAAVMLSGIYSLMSAVFYVILDAVDVAFTEAAVGAGVSTIFMLSALHLTTIKERKTPFKLMPLIVVVATGIALLYGIADLPPFGGADNPIQVHDIANHYIYGSMKETGMPNMVTSLLASYRGFDTLGETIVVMTAITAVMILIGGKRPSD